MLLSANLQLAAAYLNAKRTVISAGFQKELDWQASLLFEAVGESDFLRETTWVILASGFRERIVRGIFPDISTAFLNWCSARSITEKNAWCRKAALEVFANSRKIDAILTIAAEVSRAGFSIFRERIRASGASFLQTLPYIGPITSLHLAKNLGINVAKPDRHLVRAARSAGFASPQALCEAIHHTVGDSVALIDLVIWRYATIKGTFGCALVGP